MVRESGKTSNASCGGLVVHFHFPDVVKGTGYPYQRWCEATSTGCFQWGAGVRLLRGDQACHGLPGAATAQAAGHLRPAEVAAALPSCHPCLLGTSLLQPLEIDPKWSRKRPLDFRWRRHEMGARGTPAHTMMLVLGSIQGALTGPGPEYLRDLVLCITQLETAFMRR